MLSKDLAPALTDDQFEIATCISDLNMIRLGPLNESEIELWTRTITRLRPNITPEIIAKIMDKFLTGEWFYDKDLGITNLFKAIDEYTSDIPVNFRSV